MNSWGMIMKAVKTVGQSGQITLGKRFAGRHYVVEERPGGELLLRAVNVQVTPNDPDPVSGPDPFRIAEVKRVTIPSREDRNARR